MKIKTTEAVRRFNAQVEIADLTLSRHTAYKSCDWLSLERLHFKLLESGYSGLADAMKETAEALGYFRSTGAANPRQSPHTVFETRTKSADPISFLSQEIVEDLEREICGRETAWSDIELIAVAERLIRRSDLSREYDEMRTTLKQSRKAIIACVKSMRDAQFIPLETTLSEAMDRINAIIPLSEV